MATYVKTIEEVKRVATLLKKGSVIECQATKRISCRTLSAQLPNGCHLQFNSKGDILTGNTFYLRKD